MPLERYVNKDGVQKELAQHGAEEEFVAGATAAKSVTPESNHSAASKMAGAEWLHKKEFDKEHAKGVLCVSALS